MEQAAKDAAAFARSPETLGALKAKLSAHLAGAAESGADYFALYLDFAAKGAEPALGYTAVYGDDESALYTKARGWGLEKKSAARNRGPGDGAYMNFVLDNTVIVDLHASGFLPHGARRAAPYSCTRKMTGTCTFSLVALAFTSSASPPLMAAVSSPATCTRALFEAASSTAGRTST